MSANDNYLPQCRPCPNVRLHDPFLPNVDNYPMPPATAVAHCFAVPFRVCCFEQSVSEAYAVVRHGASDQRASRQVLPAKANAKATNSVCAPMKRSPTRKRLPATREGKVEHSSNVIEPCFFTIAYLLPAPVVNFSADVTAEV